MSTDDPEIRHIRFFLTELGYAPGLQLTRGEPPEPDVILHGLHTAGPVGVEVTELNPLGQERRYADGAADQTLALAKSLYSASGRPPVDVWVFWSAFQVIVKAKRGEIAKALAAFIASNLPPVAGRLEFDSAADPPALLPEGVDRLIITRHATTGELWFSPRVALLPNISSADVQEALERKNPKIANYTIPYAERWLLCVAGAGGPGSWGLISDDLLSGSFETPFDRLFVAALHQPGAIELRVRAG